MLRPVPELTPDVAKAKPTPSARQQLRPLVEQFLKERGLVLSADKTRITHIDEGFDFLGQNLRKYDGKPLVKPSKKNTHAFLEKVRGIIDANKSVSQTLLIGLLNPVIRGWANYHQHGAAKETFDRVDHESFESRAGTRSFVARSQAGHKMATSRTRHGFAPTPLSALE